MASNYLKRKAKETGLTPLTKEEETVEFTHIAYDVYPDSSKKNYTLVVFEYNPESGDVEVKSKQVISRQIGLSFEERKKALKTLARIK